MSLIFISGVSGVGKTTVGKLVSYIAKKHGIRTKYIDQDDFYKKNKPPVRLSNRSTTSNWDCVDAIEWEALNQTLAISRSQYQLTILAGFALWDNLIVEKPDSHYLLVWDKENTHIQQQILKHRKKSKKFNKRQSRRDKLMVHEVVLPFYLETLQHLGPHEIIERGNAESMAFRIFKGLRG